jgi:hypothetical protein
MVDNNPIERQAKSRANLDLERLLLVNQGMMKRRRILLVEGHVVPLVRNVKTNSLQMLPDFQLFTCTNNNQTYPILFLQFNYQVSLM